MSTRIAVVGGGRGFIGKQLCKSLELNGYNVKVVSRTPQNGCITWNDIKENGLPNGTNAVFNLAGELVLNPLKRWNKTLENEIIKSRVDTTQLLRDAIIGCHITPQFWGSCSGVGYYPPHNDVTYDEDSRVEAPDEDFWAKLTQQWEKAAEIPQELQSDVRHVIVRTGVVIGRGGGALQSMYPAFYMGVGGPVASGQQWFPWIHMDDIVGIWMHALQNNNVSGVLNGVSPHKITNSEFSKTFGSVLRRPAIVPLPAFAVNLLFGDVRASMLTKGQKVDPKRTIQSGYRFKYSDIYKALENSV